MAPFPDEFAPFRPFSQEILKFLQMLCTLTLHKTTFVLLTCSVKNFFGKQAKRG